MSQYGAANKNPPWVRSAGDVWMGAGPGAAMNSGPGMGQPQAAAPQQQPQQMMGQMATNHGMVQYQQTQPAIFQTSLGMQQAGMTMNTMTAIGNSSMQTTLGPTQMFQQVGTVSYPAPRALNPAAFTAPAVSAAAAAAQPSVPVSTKQRVFTGTVTKVHDNFGFVDEDVFFQTSCCTKGSNPQVGDRVLVEASYNPNMPFKWNATRVQVLPSSAGVTAPVVGVGVVPRAMPQPVQQPQQPVVKGFGPPQPATYNAVPPPGENNTVVRAQQRKPLGRRPRSRDHNRNTDDDEADRKRRREERIKEREEKEKEKPNPAVQNRSKSPRVRPVRRPRIVPRYMVQIPKIALDLPEADVLELRRRYNNLYIPSDFFSTSFRWVDAFPPHTPFSLDRPCTFYVMHKEVDPVIENSAVLEPPDADYIFSAKVMLMSMPVMEEIWRKCCSVGEDRERDKDSEEGRDFVHPTRLVNFLVGLRGKNETMAVGGPWSPSLDGPNPEKDPSVLIKTAIRTCRALTSIDLSSCTQWYRFLEIYYRRGETTHKGRSVPARVETVVLFLPDVWSCVPTRLEWDGLQLGYTRQLERKLRCEQDQAAGTKSQEKDGDEDAEDKKDPTHFSELDPKTMKVNDLRTELEARTLSSKGLKSQLIARLTKALKTEAEKEEEERERKAAEPAPPPKPEPKEDKREDEEKKKQEEKERQAKEKRYTLPETPHVLVHPSRTAKSGKFDCTIMSLSVLLDYRPEDTKEHSFEVSLFAELFNEMLMRDFGFRIYRALHDAPEKVKEEEKDHKKDKKDEKDRKDKKDDRKNGKRDDREDRHKDKRDDSKNKTEDKDDEDEDEDDDDDDSKDSKKDKDKDKRLDKDKKKKERGKTVTEDPNLLLSFVYFDQTHCGYILDKDIEELLFILGLNLSRAQVRKLVQKVVTRDSLHYHKLTDRSKKDEEQDAEKVEKKPVSGEDVASLAYGNKHLLPVFCSGVSSKRARKGSEGAGNGSSLPDGFVMYRGSLLHVEKLMQQLKRSEQARLDTEAKMLAVKEELLQTKESAGQLSVNVQDLSSELESTRTTLDSTTRELTAVTMNSDAYYEALREISDKVKPLLARTRSTQSKIVIKQEGSRWHNMADTEVVDPKVADPKAGNSKVEDAKAGDSNAGNSKACDSKANNLSADVSNADDSKTDVSLAEHEVSVVTIIEDEKVDNMTDKETVEVSEEISNKDAAEEDTEKKVIVDKQENSDAKQEKKKGTASTEEKTVVAASESSSPEVIMETD